MLYRKLTLKYRGINYLENSQCWTIITKQIQSTLKKLKLIKIISNMRKIIGRTEINVKVFNRRFYGKVSFHFRLSTSFFQTSVYLIYHMNNTNNILYEHSDSFKTFFQTPSLSQLLSDLNLVLLWSGNKKQ